VFRPFITPLRFVWRTCQGVSWMVDVWCVGFGVGVFVEIARVSDDTHLVKILAISPRPLDHASCVQHEEVDVAGLLSQLLPRAGIADISLHAVDIPAEVLLRKVERFLVRVGNGDLHAVLEA
jgi:hypothetical protein